MKMFEKMKSVKEKVQQKADMICIGVGTVAAMGLGPVTAHAADTAASSAELDVSDATNTITTMIGSLLSPLLGIVGAVGTLYCVLLGVKFAKAEEPQEREKAKTHLKNAIIGFVLIFVLIVALKLMMPQFEKWVNGNTNLNITTK